MKKILLIIGIIATLAAITRLGAAEPAVAVEFYRPFEFQVEGSYSTVTPDFEQERGNAGIGVNFFFTRNLGLGASTSVGNLNGHLLDNVSLRGIYRVPIDRTALYGYGGSTRLLQREEWTIDLGIGLEHRFAPNFGPFIEAGMIKLLKHSAEATGRVGIRLSF